jgi:ubiquinone/menaquinone biosynthesis C-methylase UbiE
MRALSVKQWETYYRGGALATGPTGTDGVYDLEVRQAWVEFFSTLRDGARVLDIGTGNGVVALIAAETAKSLGRNWRIDATDLAQINPLRDVPGGGSRLAGIAFHGGVATERLPFDAESFDAVSGHYALEYGDVPVALAEIFRVLKPGGDGQFILHNSESVLIRNARWSLLESDFLFKENKVFRRLHHLLTLDNASKDVILRATAEVRLAIQSLKDALQRAQQVGAGHVLSVALDATQKLLVARKENAPSVGQEIDRVESDIRDSARRLNDLVASARSEEDMAQIEKAAAAVGFTQIERVPQYYSGKNLVGWQLLLHRP